MLFALSGIFYFLGLACGIATLVFFIMVLIQMFKREESTMGIICIVLFFCGIGPLVAFIYGWTKAKDWDMKQIMTYWTIAFAGQIICMGLAFATALGGAATIDPSQFDPNEMNFEIEMDDFSEMEGFPEMTDPEE